MNKHEFMDIAWRRFGIKIIERPDGWTSMENASFGIKHWHHWRWLQYGPFRKQEFINTGKSPSIYADPIVVAVNYDIGPLWIHAHNNCGRDTFNVRLFGKQLGEWTMPANGGDE